MGHLTPLSISDLNTAINHEPRVLDTRLGEALGLRRPRAIRQTIERNLIELEQYGGATRRGTLVEGNEVVEYFLNEPQAILICMFSRTPRAAEVRKQVIDVFMAHRRGESQKALPAQQPRRDTPGMVEFARLGTELKRAQDENAQLKVWIDRLIMGGR